MPESRMFLSVIAALVIPNALGCQSAPSDGPQPIAKAPKTIVINGGCSTFTVRVPSADTTQP